MREIATSERTISDWFHLYSNDVYHFLIYRMGTTEVEDLVQETFIKAIKGLDSFQARSNPKTWLFSIARNVAIDELRKRQRSKWKNLLPYDSKYDVKSEETPESILGLNDESTFIYEAIKKIKPNYRDVVILRGIKELSVGETANVLNWSESKVRSTYHRALKTLHQELGGVIK